MKTISLQIILLLFLLSCQKKEVANEKPIENAVLTEDNKPKSDSPILGIDVSHFQGDIDWSKIKDAGIIFVYDKATEGNTYVDPDYEENKKGAHATELAHGSYHFFISNDDPTTQAKSFLSVIDYTEGDMPPVLDLEQGGIKGNLDNEKFQKDIMTWLKIVETQIGVKPIIYTSHSFGNQYLNQEEFSNYELWIAEYGVETPKIPKIWDQKGWLIWQRAEKGTIEGAIGQVDHDIFNPEKQFIIKGQAGN